MPQKHPPANTAFALLGLFAIASSTKGAGTGPAPEAFIVCVNANPPTTPTATKRNATRQTNLTASTVSIIRLTSRTWWLQQFWATGSHRHGNTANAMQSRSHLHADWLGQAQRTGPGTPAETPRHRDEKQAGSGFREMITFRSAPISLASPMSIRSALAPSGASSITRPVAWSDQIDPEAARSRKQPAIGVKPHSPDSETNPGSNGTAAFVSSHTCGCESSEKSQQFFFSC